MLLVGPYNDHGYSQAQNDAGLYVEEKIPGSKMICMDKVNRADRPGTTPAQLAEELINQGAKLIIFNSDDMKDGALEFAQAHPEVPVIHASGDADPTQTADDFYNQGYDVVISSIDTTEALIEAEKMVGRGKRCGPSPTTTRAGGLNLWTGPLNLQDGTPYLQDGELATEQQVWYLPQLLKGMEGQSVSQ